MNKSDLPIRKFNPGTFQSDEQVIDQFVVRKHELDIVLEVLRGEHRFTILPACSNRRASWSGKDHAANPRRGRIEH